MRDTDTDFMVQIEDSLIKEGFNLLSINRAADATEAIKGFIADLAWSEWDGESLGYGG
jgi:hypothetical protein